MRYCYSILYFCLLPLIFIRLWWLGIKAPAYRRRWAERLGIIKSDTMRSEIWVHAVSVGEVLASLPIINALIQKYPNHSIIVTTMTPTGSEQVKKHFAGRVQHVYLPYDVPFAINRFLDQIQPRILLIMETELWPNMIHCTSDRGIPICLVNARLSEQSFKGYRRFKFLTQDMLKKISVIMAQFDADAMRFEKLLESNKNIEVTGNVKFDNQVKAEDIEEAKNLKSRFKSRRVWVAASTHEGEEDILLAAHKRLLDIDPNALLFIAPRHPERFPTVKKLIQQKQMNLVESTDISMLREDVSVVLINQMGQLMKFLGAADVAFIGGSLIPHGGHNPLEPALWSMPVIMGPSQFNFYGVCQLLREGNAIVEVADGETLYEEMRKLFLDSQLRQQLGGRACSVVKKNQGSLTKTLSIIETFFPDRSSNPIYKDFADETQTSRRAGLK